VTIYLFLLSVLQLKCIGTSTTSMEAHKNVYLTTCYVAQLRTADTSLCAIIPRWYGCYCLFYCAPATFSCPFPTDGV